MQLRTLGALALFILGGSFGSVGCETHKAGSDELGKQPAPPVAVAVAAPPAAPDEARPPTEPPTEKLPTDAVDVVPSGGPSCDQAADNLMLIIENTVKKQSPEQLPMFQAQKGQVRAQFVGQCNADNWTAEAKNCVLKAKTETDLQPCQALLPNKQNEAPADPPAPPSAPPTAPPVAPADPPVAAAPVDRGGPPCDQVARNVAALVKQVQDVPADQDEALLTNIRGMCDTAGWSRKVKECFAVAKRAEDLTECQRYANVEAQAQDPKR